MVLGVPGRLKSRIITTFGTTRVVSRQPNAPAAFTSGEIPGIHFQRLSRPQGTWFYRKEPREKSPVTPPGIDPGTVRLVAQRLNHYATPGPLLFFYSRIIIGAMDIVSYICAIYRGTALRCDLKHNLSRGHCKCICFFNINLMCIRVHRHARKLIVKNSVTKVQ